METAESNFTEVIQDHLALKERNRPLERSMPLERYKTRDPFENHPLFKTEEQARIEETSDGAENGEVAADGSKVDLWTANAAGSYAMMGTATF